MSRSRGGKRPVVGSTKCNSHAKKRKTVEQNNELGLPNSERGLPVGIKFSKKGDSKGFSNIELNSKHYQKELLPIIEAAFKCKNKSSNFEVIECRDLRNLVFEKEYAEMRKELRQNGLPKEATTDQYGFLFARLEGQVKEWCQQGIRIGHVKNSRLGKADSGVNLAQYIDIVCPTSLLPDVGWICVVKYFKGRVYHACASATPLEPQPNYDCHLPSFKSNSSWTRGNADTFFGNQIFLYEYTEEFTPKLRPRQVLPFIALKYRCKANRMAQAIPDTSNINRYRLALQREREDRNAIKPNLSNRQHPGVPLVAIKPKPPPLITCSIRQVAKQRLSISSGGTNSPVTPAPPSGKSLDSAKSHSMGYDGRRTSTENIVPDSCAGNSETSTTKNSNAQWHQKRKSEACEGDKLKANDVEDDRKTEQHQLSQAEEREQYSNVVTQSHQRQKHPSGSERPLNSQQRPERPNPNIGMKHFSAGHIVSFLKLKAGDYFQAKMDLVSYADTLSFPLAVLYMRLSPKLSIRKFISMSRLRQAELGGAEVSIKKEFLCPNCNRYATYYRLYIRQNTNGNVEMSKLCDYMRIRETVGVVHFTTESHEMLMFPDSEFSKSIGIPQFETTSTDSPLFLHCLLMTPQPKIDYYQRLVYPVVNSDDQLLDEVLKAYIWADADIPPLTEEEAALLGSYAGEWPTTEAVEQSFNCENEIQHRFFLQSCGRGPATSKPIGYRGINFHRRMDFDSFISTAKLQAILENVAAADLRMKERRLSTQSSSSVATPVAQEERCVEADDEPSDHASQNSGQSSRLSACEVDAKRHSSEWNSPPEHSRASQRSASPNEPATVAFSKCVFDDPPASPSFHRSGSTPTERPVLVEMNPVSETTTQPIASTCRASRNAEISANMQQLRVGLDQILSVIRSSMYGDTRRSPMENASNTSQAMEISDSPDDDESRAFNAYEMQNRAAQEARQRFVNQPASPPSPSSISSSASLERSPIIPSNNAKMDSQWSYRPSDDDAQSTSRSVSALEMTEEEIHRELEEGLMSSRAACANGVREARDISGRRQSGGCEAGLEETKEGADGEESTVAARPCPTLLASFHASSPSRLVRPNVASPGLAGRRDHRFLRKSGLLPTRRDSSSPLTDAGGLANGADSDLSPPTSPLKSSPQVRKSILPARLFAHPNPPEPTGSELELSPELPEDCNKPGSRIPVMVSKRRIPTTSAAQSQSTTSTPYGDCLPGVYRMPVPVPVPVPFAVPVGVPMPLSLPVAPTPPSQIRPSLNGTSPGSSALTLMERDSTQMGSVRSSPIAGGGGCDVRIWQP